MIAIAVKPTIIDIMTIKNKSTQRYEVRGIQIGVIQAQQGQNLHLGY